MELAEVANRVRLERLAHLIDVPAAEVRRGNGWMAVRTGASSNDANVVLNVEGATIDQAIIDTVLEWMRGVPATWNVDSPDERLTKMLLHRRARPERSGSWCGRALTPSATAGWQTIEVSTDGHVDAYLDVLQACGWFDPNHCEAKRASIPFDQSFRHVLAVDDAGVGGVATGFIGSALEIVDIAVRTEARRQGGGRALISDLENWGAVHDTGTVLAAPSPDGAELFRALRFDFQRVQPDLCFYLE